MKCVHYGFKNPTSFEEHLDFSRQMPYTVRIKKFLTEDIVPLHYGETIEILLCDHLKGEVVIDSNRYELSGEQLFIVPPYTVHSNSIEICDGTLYVVKVCFPEMKYYLDIPHILESSDISVLQFLHVCDEYDQVRALVEQLIQNDGDFLYCIGCITQLFRIFSKHTDSARSPSNASYLLNKSDLRELISWTQQNFQHRISLDDVAKKAGYSKYYFCNRFKAMTGSTYFHYLNSVRIEYACRLLRDGRCINDVCYACGFEDVPYFIQTFKKIHHITPKQYVRKINSFLAEEPDPPANPSPASSSRGISGRAKSCVEAGTACLGDGI